MMNLAVVSVRRPGGHDFVFESLLSLLEVGGFAGPVHLFPGDVDSGHLDFLAAAPRAVLHPMGLDEWAPIAGLSLQRRQAFACWRALDHFARLGEDLCLCEDDVRYDVDFAAKAAAAIAEVGATAASADFLLTFYSDREFPDHRPGAGRATARYPAENFYGAQAVYFSAATIGRFAEHLRYWGIDRDTVPTDLLIRDYGVERGNLYYVEPSVAQHIGRVSVSGAGFHTSPTFGRPWPTDLPGRPPAG